MTKENRNPSRLRLALRRATSFASWAVIVVLAFLIVRQVYPRIDLGVEHDRAPDFELLDLEGLPFRLADQQGKVIVLNFWATWCPPCRAEIPGFIRLQDEFREEGVLFVGVALDEEGAEVVGPYAEQRGINYPIVLDRGTVARAYNSAHVVPTTLLIDRQGMIRFRHEGLIMPRALRPAIVDLVAEEA